MERFEDPHRLFIDKYRPQSFDEIQFNQDVAKKFIACSKNNQIPHIVIKGPNGSGKKTFANLYIRTKYGKSNLQMRHQHLEINHASKSIEIQFLYSQYHYHIDPSAYGVYDRLIIQGFIKDILQIKPICDIPYHLIVIEHADRLTVEAQQSLRRTLEKHIDNCRFIFLINQDSTLIEPLMSRCVQLRLSSPSYSQVEEILQKIVMKEAIKANPHQIAQIAKYSQRNITIAIDLLQSLAVLYPNLLENETTIDFTDINDIDRHYQSIIGLLNSKLHPKTILMIRSLLYDLLVHCVEPLDIMKSLFHRIFDTLKPSPPKQKQLIDILEKYENTLKQGSKPIYHLEGFIISTMNL
jgi:replication factor C subunit 3/5